MKLNHNIVPIVIRSPNGGKLVGNARSPGKRNAPIDQQEFTVVPVQIIPPFTISQRIEKQQTDTRLEQALPIPLLQIPGTKIIQQQIDGYPAAGRFRQCSNKLAGDIS